MLHAAGVDIIDVSAGQTSVRAAPVYGRMFQTPFSDRIRNETGIATMAVGNIYEPDHVNSILMAGRADLCCLCETASCKSLLDTACGRSARLCRRDLAQPYLSGREQLQRLATRSEGTGERV